MFDVSVEMLCNLKDCGWEIFNDCVRKEPLCLGFHKDGVVVEIQYDLRKNQYTFIAYYSCTKAGAPAMTYEDMFIFTKLMNELEVKEINKRLTELEEHRKCILQK
jgi:hypothetical protein